MKYRLNEIEEASLEAFLARRACAKIMKNGGELAIVFSSGSAIGVTVIVKIRDKDGNEAEENITDYGSW